MWIVKLIDLLYFSEQIERAKEQNKTKFDVNEFKKFCDDHQQNNIGGRMSIKKSDRILVFQKCKGHCAYCGKKIELEEMQVDHIVPKHLDGKDEIENYNPSCRRCNHYKRTLTLEKFRKLIMTLTERLQKIYIVRVAIDYGIVTLNKWDEKFYFERKKIQTIKLTPPSYSITAKLENGSKVSIPISLGDLENESMQINFNLPSHYDFRELKQSTMEIINIVAEANSGGVFKIGWYLANALKYLFRFRRKDGVKDLKKARDYIDRLINYFEREDENVD